MCDNAIFYSSSNLWSYWDDGATNCYLNFDLFTYQSNDQDRLQTPRFKFSIYGKETASATVTLANNELYKFSYLCKQKILTPLNSHIEKLNRDKSYTDGFCFKTRKNNIYATFMHQTLLNAPCVRFMIGDKEQSLIDTDKLYLPLVEFNSLYLTMNKSFENFCILSQNIVLMNQFKKYTELFEEKIDDLDRTIYNLKNNNTVDYTTTATVTDYTKEDVSNVTFDESENEEKESLPVETVVEEKTDSEIDKDQNEFDSFLKDNRDSFELDLPEKQNINECQDLEIENTFQKKILNKDFSEIDQLALNCVNSEIPLNSFVNTIYQLSGENLYEGLNDGNIYAINYLTSVETKTNVKKYLEDKRSFPKLLYPIIMDEYPVSAFKTHCMNYFLMCYVYLSRITNELVGCDNVGINKSFTGYVIKTITSPFVFSTLLKHNKNVVVACVSRLYKKLRDNHYFDKYEDDIYKATHKRFDITEAYIESQVEKIYDNIEKFVDKLSIQNHFKKWMKLNYSDLNELDGKFNQQKIEILLKLEFGKNVDTTLDLPVSILEKFGVKNQKFDVSYVFNYIKSKYPKFKYLEQIKTINVSINDIIQNIDLNECPIDILKAFYFWESNKTNKSLKYDDYIKMISNSSLNEKDLISMLLKNDYKMDEEFYNSLTVVYNE